MKITSFDVFGSNKIPVEAILLHMKVIEKPISGTQNREPVLLVLLVIPQLPIKRWTTCVVP